MRNRRSAIIQTLSSIIYKITYDLNGGVLNEQNPSEYTLKTSDFILNEPTRSGFSFLGWTLNNEKNYSLPQFGDYGNKKYTAHWKMNVTSSDYSENIDPETFEIKASDDINKDGVYDNYEISIKGSSNMEKVNLPLPTLIPNQKYILYFTESNNAQPGSIYSGYSQAAYGCYVNNTKQIELNASNKENFRAQNGLIAEWNVGQNGSITAIDGLNFNGPRDMEVNFQATNKNMYWVWDFGGSKDGQLYKYYFNDIYLEPVAPIIRFSAIALKDTAPLATLKIKEVDDTRLKLTYEFDGESGTEFLYFPITGLTPGAKYTITFEHKYQGAYINGDNGTYEYGCGIVSNLEDVQIASKMNTMTSKWLSNTWTMNIVSNSIEKPTLSFTPNSDTVYWIWNMANVSDAIIATITLNVIDFNVSSDDITYQFI